MKRIAIIENNIVQNIISVEDDYLPDEGVETIEDTNFVAYKGAIVSEGQIIPKDIKPEQISAAYSSMNNDVLTEMNNVFGTTNPVSASANHQTFLLMKTNPDLFSTEGILADKTTTSFDAGDALNTNQKIIDFATERLAEIDSYGVYRIKRIQQFQAEKAAIMTQG
jgi:hypothetical protein